MPCDSSPLRIALAFLIPFCIFPRAAHPAEGDFAVRASGTADFSYVRDAGAGDDWGSAFFAPAFEASWHGTLFRFSALAEQRTRPADAAFSVNELYVRVDLGDRFRIRAGRFPADTGPALFFHRSAFLGASDPTTIFESGGTPRTKNEDAGEFRFFGDAWSLALFAAPFAPAYALPDTQSPWFPMADIPLSFYIPFYDYYAALDSVFFDGVSGEVFTPDPAYRFSLTFNPSVADVSAVFFYGRERSVSLFPMAVWPSRTNDMNSFDIYLKPLRNLIAAFGLSASGSSADVSYWLDASATFGAATKPPGFAFSTAEPTEWPAAGSYDSFGATGGLGWTTLIGPVGIAATAEVTWSLFGNEPDDFEPPSLDRAGVFALRLYDGEERISGDSTLAVDFRDWSAALVVSARYRFTDMTALSLSAPFFFGDEDDSLGQYATRKTVHLNFTYRY
ncbi:MAG: hypothetical protein A2Z99_16920 [Treponema sp. GWB1_62_6]|nr:MAG: hypothetical protein A2Z99_16920 [Treponema sp. GWB1_62_6]OHE69732.1 MAG: hypothetical protein A2001_14450 [Treponema sp. GWC1_61_84]HCM26770.1 hypothetical protein [Treponema sp.]